MVEIGATGKDDGFPWLGSLSVLGEDVGWREKIGEIDLPWMYMQVANHESDMVLRQWVS